MKFRFSAWKFAILIGIAHCIIGNLVGIYFEGAGVFATAIEFLFLPYTFIAGMASFAGWDSGALVIEFASLLFMLAIFYIIGGMLEKK